MQIASFLPHYQLVCISFDISSFSLISYTVKEAVLHGKTASFEMQNNIFLIILLVKSLCRTSSFEKYLQGNGFAQTNKTVCRTSSFEKYLQGSSLS